MLSEDAPTKSGVTHDVAAPLSIETVEAGNCTTQSVGAVESNAGFLTSNSVAANSTETKFARDPTTATTAEHNVDGDGIASTAAKHLFAGEHGKESDVQEIEGNLKIFWHHECYLHKIEQHPEQPDRMTHILAALRERYPPDCFYEAPLATDRQILLFHSADHLSRLKSLCTAAENGHDCGNSEMYQSVDCDTVVMWRTRRAMLRAAGSTVAAVNTLYEFNPLDRMAK